MECYILEGRNKQFKLVYQSRVYFTLSKIIELKRKMKQDFGQELTFFIC
jgi:hypothetical protein